MQQMFKIAKEYPGFPDLDIYKCPFWEFANTFENSKNFDFYIINPKNNLKKILTFLGHFDDSFNNII